MSAPPAVSQKRDCPPRLHMGEAPRPNSEPPKKNSEPRNFFSEPPKNFSAGPCWGTHRPTGLLCGQQPAPETASSTPPGHSSHFSGHGLTARKTKNGLLRHFCRRRPFSFSQPLDVSASKRLQKDTSPVSIPHHLPHRQRQMVDVQNKSSTICADNIRRNMASGYTVE